MKYTGYHNGNIITVEYDLTLNECTDGYWYTAPLLIELSDCEWWKTRIKFAVFDGRLQRIGPVKEVEGELDFTGVTQDFNGWIVQY